MRRLFLLLPLLLAACGSATDTPTSPQATVPPVGAATATSAPAPTVAPSAPPSATTAPAPPTPVPATATNAPPPATATVAAKEQPVTIKGTGMSKSKPFTLAGGNYTVKWTATAKDKVVGCFHGGTLHAVDPAVFMMENLGGDMVKDTASGETQIYNVKPGQYYLDMTSGCDWSITIGPQ